MVEIISMNHDAQIRGVRSERSIDLIAQKAKEFNPVLIGEEFPESSLKDMRIEKTLPKAAAEKLGIEHRYCDMPLEERTRDGEEREAYWFGQIKDRVNQSVVFFCGASHIESFATLLREKGVEVSYLQAEVDAYKNATRGFMR